MAAVAARYARALADVAAAPGRDPEAVRAEVRCFLELLEQSEELRNVLATPVVPAPRKRALIERLGKPLGLSRIVLNFLFVLVDHRRTSLLRDILSSFEALLDERRGIVRAEVATAKELTADERLLLEGALRQLTRQQVRAEYSVEPGLLGGAVTRIGSTVYDGSVREQLRQIRQRLSTG